MTPRPFELRTPDGRRIRGWDTGPAAGPTVFWHGGTPNTGEPPVPLGPAADALGIRWIGADRPGYGGSDPLPGARVADVVADVALVADRLGVQRFAVLGHSGGGPRALATAVLLPERVVAAAAIASPAPGDAPFDRAAGAAPSMAAMQHAVVEGRAAVEREVAREFDPGMFTDADLAALAGPWSWFEHVVQEAGSAGQVDDEMAVHGAWGVDLAATAVPVLLVHGTADRTVPASHARWLAHAIPGAELRLVDGAGHLSVLAAGPEVLARLAGEHWSA